MTRNRTMPAAARNSDPPIATAVVDVSSTDYSAPAGAMIRGLNASAAGVIYLVDLNDVTAPEFINTGWNPCTICKTIKHHASNTATILKCAFADTVIQGS